MTPRHTFGRAYSAVEPHDSVIAKWREGLFIREQKCLQAKRWIISVMRCIEKIGKRIFTSEELYEFEDELRRLYPSNRHIKVKIRQKLQMLRDKGYLDDDRCDGEWTDEWSSMCDDDCPACGAFSYDIDQSREHLPARDCFMVLRSGNS
jgi:hypothetical protein